MRYALDIPAGIVADDTSFAASPRWLDGSNVRFRLGRPQTIGGWERLVSTQLSGTCRSILNWTDNFGILNIGFGTHLGLEVWYGGDLYDVTPATGFTPGQIDGTGGQGYGTGSYSTGNYSEPSTTDYFPLTWSLAAWGQNLLACPRNQTIFAWTNNTATAASALSNAPDNVTYMLVAPKRQVFALGCNEEVSGVFNPCCIRHSSIGNNNDWTTTTSSTAREYILPGGGRIVAGRVVGEYLFVWTDKALFLGSYVGQVSQVWRFDQIGDKCGLIAPNAAVVVGQTAYWLGPDLQFYACQLGGAPQPLPCPVREILVDHLATSQFDKITAASINQFQEIRFDYPDGRDGAENSRYLALCVNGDDAGAWHLGQMPRTAFVDAGPSSFPIGTDADGVIYWHERGHSADGGAFSWFIESSDQYMSEDTATLIRCCWPDIQGQIGPVNLTLTGRFKPQGDEIVYGPYAMATSEDKVDFKAKARLVKVKFSGGSAPTFMRLGKPIFDVKPTGQR